MEVLNECNAVKYSAYRTAAKVRALQKALSMENVKINVISGVFYRHNLRPAQNQDFMGRIELEAVIHDIIFASLKDTFEEFNIGLVTEKIVQMLYNMFKRHKDCIQVISVKVALIILCSARLEEKYKYLFHQLADHNSCLTKRRMVILLKELAAIPEYLSESLSFGCHLISPTLNNCFEHCDGDLGVTEESFFCWVVNEPQALVWLSTMYRMQASETVSHYVRCDWCKVYPIRGLRYMCLLCFKYNQCQTCFFHGKINKRHKLKHPIQEYCYETSSKEATYAFLKVLRNKLKRCTSKNLLYLPAELQNYQNESRSGEEECTSSTCSVYHSLQIGSKELPAKNIVHLHHENVSLNPQAELQSIIHNLEEENRQLLSQIESGNDPKFGEYLEDHKKLIGAQVERLKMLKLHLSKVNDLLPNRTSYNGNRQQQLRRLESTPVVPKSMKNYKHGLVFTTDLDSISPIIKDGDEIPNSINTSWQCEQRTQSISFRAKNNFSMSPSLTEHSVSKLSTCIYRNNGGGDNALDSASGLNQWLQKAESVRHSVGEINEDIDSIIDKLQNVLSSNHSIQDAFVSDLDNTQLQEAATEMEDLLAGLIKSIEINKHKKDVFDDQIFV